jgi:malic enzyme
MFVFLSSSFFFSPKKLVSLQVATAIIKEALEEGLCTKIPEEVASNEAIRAFVARKMYFPSYVPLL